MFVGAIGPTGIVTVNEPVAVGELPGCWKLEVETETVSLNEVAANAFGTVKEYVTVVELPAGR